MKFNRKKFFDGVKAEIDSTLTQQQVGGLEALITSFESDPTWTDLRHIAYAFATICIETAWTFHPIKEYGPDSYFKKYDGRASLGNTEKGDGLRFKGRGFVQITGRRNYTKFGIANNPDAALEHATAFRIMTVGMHKGIFTGKKLSDYIDGTRCDYKGARRIINGQDRAAEIAGYARKFEKILKDSAAVPSTAVPTQTTMLQPATSTEAIQPASAEMNSSQPPIDISVKQETVETKETATGTTETTTTAEATKTEVVNAPPSDGTTSTSVKTTVWGITLPAGVAVVVKVVTDLIDKGFIGAKEIGDFVMNLVSQNLPYVFILIGLIVVSLMLRKAYKQISFFLQMHYAASKDKNNVEVNPQ